MRMFRGYVSGKAEIRSMMGREFLVLPVVAFQAGVWQGLGQDGPEYTPESVLEDAPQTWNGRPVVADHPLDEGGSPVTAGDPDVFANAHLGWIFNARVEDEKLLVDAWIDMETPSAMSENVSAVLDAIEAGEPVEVSIGAFVKLRNRRGSFRGQRYVAVWTQIVPDHLAFLSDGEGACSNEDGCGVRFEANDGGASAAVETDEETMSRLAALRARAGFTARLESDAQPAVRSFLANGFFDRDVRQLLTVFLAERFTLPYVIAFSDTRMVFDAVVLDDDGDWSRIEIYVADYAIDEDNQVSLTSSVEPAWLAVAPIPYSSPVPVDNDGETTMTTETAAGASAKPGKSCGCPEQPRFESLGDLKTYLGDSPLKREIETLETIRDDHRAELMTYIGDDAQGFDLAACSLDMLTHIANTVERARASATEAAKAEQQPPKPVYHGRAGNGAAAGPKRPPRPPKVFEDFPRETV